MSWLQAASLQSPLFIPNVLLWPPCQDKGSSFTLTTVIKKHIFLTPMSYPVHSSSSMWAIIVRMQKLWKQSCFRYSYSKKTAILYFSWSPFAVFLPYRGRPITLYLSTSLRFKGSESAQNKQIEEIKNCWKKTRERTVSKKTEKMNRPCLKRTHRSDGVKKLIHRFHA